MELVFHSQKLCERCIQRYRSAISPI